VYIVRASLDLLVNNLYRKYNFLFVLLNVSYERNMELSIIIDEVGFAILATDNSRKNSDIPHKRLERIDTICYTDIVTAR
jgi:hypothetical protein